eukprot:TRINITY_DN18582_c0_g1_i1.p1 TRINITY_DN18582_c0_g1~~TRINITY_DN18582_c0_g1_i1.p1  ORF type:complete len:690 (-),score=61.84 TRINITY_DN18582_c0_g1_i1:114-2183(-)
MTKQGSQALRGWMLVLLLLSREVHSIRLEVELNTSGMEQGSKSGEMQAMATQRGFTGFKSGETKAGASSQEGLMSHDAGGLGEQAFSEVEAPKSTDKSSLRRTLATLPEEWAVMTSDVMYNGTKYVLALHKLPGKDSGCRLKLYKSSKGSEQLVEVEHVDIDKAGAVGTKNGELHVETPSSTFTARPYGGKAHFVGLSIDSEVIITNSDYALASLPGRIKNAWVDEKVNRLFYAIQMNANNSFYTKVDAKDVVTANGIVEASNMGKRYTLSFANDDALLNNWLSVITTTQAIGTCLARGACFAQCTYMKEEGTCWPPKFCKVRGDPEHRTCEALTDDEKNAKAFGRLLKDTRNKFSNIPTTKIPKAGMTKEFQDVSTLVKYLIALHRNTLKSPDYSRLKEQYPLYTNSLEEKTDDVNMLQIEFMNSLDQALGSFLGFALRQSKCDLEKGALKKTFEAARKGHLKPVEELSSRVRACQEQVNFQFGGAKANFDPEKEESELKCLADANTSDTQLASRSAVQRSSKRSTSKIQRSGRSSLAQIGSDEIMSRRVDPWLVGAGALVGCAIMAAGAALILLSAVIAAIGYVVCFLFEVLNMGAKLVTGASGGGIAKRFPSYQSCVFKSLNFASNTMMCGFYTIGRGAQFAFFVGGLWAALVLTFTMSPLFIISPFMASSMFVDTPGNRSQVRMY